MSRTQLPARLRLRRRLAMLSALPALLVLAFAVKLISVVIAGHSAQSHYAGGAIGALRDDVSTLQIVNIIEPANAPFAAGDLAVLDDRLDTADAQFSQSLAATDPAESCPVRVNLELVRERQGDIDAWEARLDVARQRYDGALAVIADAPPGCFAGNRDPDGERRAVREDAAARVAAKIRGLGSVAPPAPPVPPAPVEVPAAPPAVAPDQTQPPETRRLDPSGGDPLEVLQRVLRDAATG